MTQFYTYTGHFKEAKKGNMVNVKATQSLEPVKVSSLGMSSERIKAVTWKIMKINRTDNMQVSSNLHILRSVVFVFIWKKKYVR